MLYLDFDGVLHHSEVYWTPKRGIFIKDAPGRSLFEWMPVLEQLLEPHPDVKIVLSTSWCVVRSFNFAKKQLSTGLRERVIGATYHRRHMPLDSFDMLGRGGQVIVDTKRRGLAREEWVALDDDWARWPDWCYEGNFIGTAGETGLSDPAVQAQVRAWLERF
ncbi:HAD domain-containing protein [Noviherbaspirillum sp. UKPF54]|uniref:HAD domain-containing protein n=1 Tax=Noviherbaspirillum sp. UKPF54 TaxID=2601898 RepID=UPI001FEEE861|nr:HAD domain-containing protein [Noviherbaspirillum sp. UKPF54]